MVGSPASTLKDGEHDVKVRPVSRAVVFLQLQSTVWVQAPSWINEGVVLPGGCNLTRDEQEVEAVCKEVIIIMVHGI